VAVVRAAGAVILGKTATPEGGWKGRETTSRVHGSPENPWRARRLGRRIQRRGGGGGPLMPDVLHRGR
jgi:aspartyl-tRNA(Asn)/glutamyl-tRNA(Gln) amidotransferase subunit A